MKRRNLRGNGGKVPNNAAGKPKKSGQGGNKTQAERAKQIVAKFELTATSIGGLRKKELIRRIQTFEGRFNLDFTGEYLNKLSEDRLRHILLAALINAGKPK
ncbi:MAG: hypothetical protein Q8N60_03270 [Candidatus Diapherotrites archaeon]|nr:hypothetical protein [Candidatus Diapherotrites archaeon]